MKKVYTLVGSDGRSHDSLTPGRLGGHRRTKSMAGSIARGFVTGFRRDTSRNGSSVRQRKMRLRQGTDRVPDACGRDMRLGRGNERKRDVRRNRALASGDQRVRSDLSPVAMACACRREAGFEMTSGVVAGGTTER